MATENDEDGTVKNPINREPEPAALVDSFLTPADSQPYDRNHGPIPHISREDHRVQIEGLVPRSVSLSVSDLEFNFRQHSVVCALQCAGNRRHAMRTRLQEVQGIDWFDGAILNAKWSGPLLRDVLLQGANLSDQHDNTPDQSTNSTAGNDNTGSHLHVQLACYQQPAQEDSYYGGSIPLARALSQDAEVVLALRMNDEPLSIKHGFPVRAVVPGVIGARSVKWLDRISVAEHESPNFYQRHDYKVLPPQATDKKSAEPYWDKTPPMMDNVINAVVATPEDQETVKLADDGTIRVRGYAVPQGGGGPVVRVEVAVVVAAGGDEELGEHGENVEWVEARLGPRERWSWCLWEADVRAQRGEGMRVLCRATDRQGNTQTQLRSQWNLRGVGYNGFESTVGLKIV